MNVLVDGRPFIRTSAGIATVLRCVLFTWAKQHKEDTFYVVLAKPMHQSMGEYSFPENIKWIMAKNIVFRNLPNSFYLFIMVPFLIRKYHIDLYYSPVPVLPYCIPQRVKTVITVHDVVNLEFSETMYLKNRIANFIFFSRAINKADIIWAVSEYTKGRIEYYFPQRKCKEIFVGSAVDRSLFRKIVITEGESRSIKNKFGIKDRFMLFVGSLEPRKNLPFLLGIAPEIYEKTSIQLVVVGAKGWKNTAIREIIVDSSFPKDCTVFCGYVSNEDLVKLYNMAECFVSASLNEGFGLPQLEAFMCGCPVVTAANSAMIEVAKNRTGGLLINGYEHEFWRDSIMGFLKKHESVQIEEFADYDWKQIVSRIKKTIS